MVATNEWTATCERWAGQLSEAPNGVQLVLEDLVCQYGWSIVFEQLALVVVERMRLDSYECGPRRPATSANDKRHADAYELATWANQLVAVSRHVHTEAASLQPNAYRLQLLDNLERRCEKVSELAQRFTNDVEG